MVERIHVRDLAAEIERIEAGFYELLAGMMADRGPRAAAPSPLSA